MSEEKATVARDDMTDEQRFEDLKARRVDHVFMTTEEAVAWNDKQEKTSLSKNHWSVKAVKVKHVLRMGANWKHLAKALWTDLRKAKADAQSWRDVAEANIDHCQRLGRMMERCDKCGAPAGSECNSQCSRDGNRDT